MKVIIQSIDCDRDELIEERIRMKIYKIWDRYDWIMEVKVYLKVEKSDQNRNKIVELFLSIPGHDLYAVSQEEKFELSVKKVMENMRHQLQSYIGIHHAHPVKTL